MKNFDHIVPVVILIKKYMIQKEIRLPLPILTEVLRLAPVLNNTYFLQVAKKSHQRTSKTRYLHMDEENNIISSYQIDNHQQPFIALSEDEILIPVLREHRLVVLYLRKDREESIPFEFRHNIGELQLMYFPETEVVMVKQVWTDKDRPLFEDQKYHVIDITYLHKNKMKRTFNRKIFENSSARVNVLQDKSQNYENEISQCNYHSMLVLKRIQSDCDFLLLDLFMDQSNKINSRTRKIVIPQKYFDEIIIMVGLTLQFWQFRKNQIIVLSKQNGLSQMVTINLADNSFNELTCKNPKYDNFVDLQFSNQFIIVSKSQMHLPNMRGYILPPNYKPFHNLISNDTYLFNILTEQISHQFRSPKQAFILRDICDYDPSLLIITSLDYKKKIANVLHIQIGLTADMYMHMLLHLNDDFDDDLLMEAMELLN